MTKFPLGQSSLIPVVLLCMLLGCAPKPFLERFDTEAVFPKRDQKWNVQGIRGLVMHPDGGITYAAGSSPYAHLIRIDDQFKQQWVVNMAVPYSAGNRLFLNGPVLDGDSILISGIFQGELSVNAERKLEPTGRLQSFIAKFGPDGKLGWITEYKAVDVQGSQLVLFEMRRFPRYGLVAAGILDDTTAVMIGIEPAGKVRWHIRAPSGKKIYTLSMAETHGELHLSAIGEYFIHLHAFDKGRQVKWKMLQDTEARLLTRDTYILPGVSSGVWVATSFSTANQDEAFIFGRDTLTGDGDNTHFDGYITQIRDGQQAFSRHISGAGDQIVTGMFEADRINLGFALAHAEEFKIGDLYHQHTRGFSIVEFNKANPAKVVYSTFPLDAKGRERMVNTGVFFRQDGSGHAWLGGILFMGEGQQQKPELTIGDQSLTAPGILFNTFLVRGIKKKSASKP